MQFRILGPLAVRTADGRPVHLGAAKHRIFLGMLLLSANRTVGADRLAGALWSSRPPRSAASALTTYASALRGHLGLSRGDGLPALVADGGGYRIRVAPADVDLLVFADLAASGQRALAGGDPVSAVDRLQQALALWRGAPLEDVPLEGESHIDLSWLDELRADAAEASIEARLALGRHAEVVPELGALVTANPLRERLQGMLMTALYRCGRQADALAAYRRLREHLVGELGIEPGPPLRQLHRQILAGSPELDPPPQVPVGPPADAAPVPRQLPADVGGFTGRRVELGLLGRSLRPAAGPAPVPIAAIDGIGGIGKSALAVHAAHQLADRFPDGQLYADLRGGSADGPVPPLAVLERFLRGFGVECRGCASLEEVAATFRGVTATRRVLFVLDDARDARQIQPLLPAGAGCAVIVTSRQVLAGLDAEHVHLDVLSAAEAATLLGHVAGERALGADQHGTDAVARLCGYLPLALRIAGGRLAARPGWPVRALADRLSDTQQRLDELQLGDLGVRASFQVSLQALAESADPRDRLAADAFRLVAEPDGSDLGLGLAARLLDQPEAATEAVLERLVDGQLLESSAPHRYRMHDLLRLFGRDRLADPDARTAALVRGLRWYAATVRQAVGALRPDGARPGGDERTFPTAEAALAWLETERVNLCAAVHQAATTPAVPAEIATTLAHGLFGFFDLRGYRQDWLDLNRTALTVARRSGDLLAEAYARRDLGVVHERQGRYEDALDSLRASLAIFRTLGERGGQARSLASLGVIHHRQGRYLEAIRCHREALRLHRVSADRSGEARSLNNLGATYQRLERFAEAQECYQDSLTIFHELGDRRIQAAILTNLGVVHYRQRQYDKALACQELSLATFRACGDRDGQAASLNNLGRVYRRLGRPADALACHRGALTIDLDLGERLGEAECLREIGTTLRALGQRAQTETYWCRALVIFNELGVPEAAEVRSLLADLRAPSGQGVEPGALSLA